MCLSGWACASSSVARSYLVSEVRKVGAFGSYRFAEFDDFNAFICDDATSDDAGLVRDAGLEVMCQTSGCAKGSPSSRRITCTQ